MAKAARAGRFRALRLDLPPGEPLTQYRYNQLRLSPAFHASLNASRVLFFESDTVLCSKPTVAFEAWLESGIDYVGAPWPGNIEWCPSGKDCCCNAGLSLVNVDARVESITVCGPGQRNAAPSISLWAGSRRRRGDDADRLRGASRIVRGARSKRLNPRTIHVVATTRPVFEI